MNLSNLPTDSRLNVIVHDGYVGLSNDRDDVATVSPMATVDFADELREDEWEFLRHQPQFVKLFRLVFPKSQMPDMPAWPITNEGLGVRHLIGLIVLSLHAIKQGKTPMLVMPESFLHPRAQAGLAALCVALTEPA